MFHHGYQRGRACRHAGVAGFTLIELMVTLSVLAVLVAIAVPSFHSTIVNNRLTAQANLLVAELQTARIEAIKRNARVRLCGSVSGGNWTGWNITLPSNNEVLRASQVKTAVQVTDNLPAAAAHCVEYRSDGLARDATGALLAGQFTFCEPVSRPAANQRVVSLVAGSRLSTASANGAGACP